MADLSQPVVDCCPYTVLQCAVDCVCSEQPKRNVELNIERQRAIRGGNWALEQALKEQA